MSLSSFFEPATAAIVMGGTLVATFLRCGSVDTGATMAMLARQLSAPSLFDGATVRAKLARVVQDIARDGLLRAETRSTGDGEFDAALKALVGHRSIGAAKAVLAEARAARLAPAEAAIRTLMQASELAPVFGLAGTLISLSSLPANGIDRSAYLSAIGMAVHATLYGLIMANLVLAPLARLVERRARLEEGARQQIMDWFEYEMAAAFPARHEGRSAGGHAGVHLHPAQFHHAPDAIGDGPYADDDLDAHPLRRTRGAV